MVDMAAIISPAPASSDLVEHISAHSAQLDLKACGWRPYFL